MLPEATAFHQRWLNERPDDYADNVRYRLEVGATFPPCTTSRRSASAR